MNVQCPYKSWSKLDSSLPPLIGAGDGLVCESVGKADMLSAHFDGNSPGIQ